jgi:phosphoribosylanthranilate isomerase
MFERIQLNFHAITHTIDASGFVAVLQRRRETQFIFQLDGVNHSILAVAENSGINAVPLFDLSGGIGVLPREWPRASGKYFGYAGGLSPENLAQQIDRIGKVCGEVPIWIDVETRVRSEEDRLFDLRKVEAFLKIAEPFVCKGA